MEIARLDNGDFDSQARHFFRQGFGNSFDGMFCRCVNTCYRECDLPHYARNIQNMAGFLLAHLRQNRLRHMHQPEHVGIEDPLHRGVADVFDRARQSVDAVLRAVAATRSPFFNNSSASFRPKPEEVPVTIQTRVFVIFPLLQFQIALAVHHFGVRNQTGRGHLIARFHIHQPDALCGTACLANLF